MTLVKPRFFLQYLKKWKYTPWAHLVLTSVTIIIVSLVWWRFSIFYENYLIEQKRTILQSKVEEIGNNLTSSINRRQAILLGIAASVKTHTIEDLRNGHFELFADNLRANDPTIRTIQFYPPSGQVLIFPVEGNEVIVGSTIEDLKNTDRANVRVDVLRAIESRQITLSDPYELRQGGQGIVARLAVYTEDRFLGLVVVILNLDSLLDIPGISTNPDHIDISLKDKSGKVFFGNETVFNSNPVTSRVILPEGYWVIGASPLSTWEEEIQPTLTIFWLIGMLLASLSGGITLLISSNQTNLKKMVEVRTADLSESEERFSTIFRASPIAISVNEKIDEKLVEVNDAWCNLMGFSREESIGRNMEELGIIDKEQITKLHENFIREKSLTLVNSEISVKSGEKKSIMTSAEFITMRTGKYSINLMIDITERKRVEEEIHRLNAQLEQRVAERTAELRGLVNTMAGREVRMAELKDVIRQLRDQLEQSGQMPVADDPLAGL